MSEFNRIYEQIYLNYYNQLEKMRKNKIYQFILIIATNIISLIGFYIILEIISKNESALIVVTFVGANIIFLNLLYSILYFVTYFNGRRNDKYTYFLKENVIKYLVNSIDNKLEFITGLGILESIYIQGEFENFDKYYSEDLIKGILNNGCNICLAEVRTEWKGRREVTSKTHSTFIPIFYGIYANVQLKKNINSFIQLKKNKLINLNSLGDITKINTTKYFRKK